MSGSQDRDTTDNWSGFRPLPSQDQDLLTQYTEEAVQAAANVLSPTAAANGDDNDSQNSAGDAAYNFEVFNTSETSLVLL